MNNDRFSRPYSFDDDDDDYFKFGNNRISYSKGPEEELKKLKERIGHVENESLQTTERALRSINETREIGTKTAEELVRQGEKLQNIDQKLDDVDDQLNMTQKHINNIKSIFGGLKNRFTRKTKDKISEISNDKSTGNSVTSRQIQQQPIQTKADFVPLTGSDREKEMFKNLEEMSVGLTQITSLAKDMSKELDRQSCTIDRITDKTDKTKAKMDFQHHQMKKVLK